MPAPSHDTSLLCAIESTRTEGTTTIAVSGELDVGSANRLKAAIQDAENGTTRSIVVDLEELSFMDSTGLSVLLEARKRASLNGHSLRFVHSSHDQVKQLLSITGSGEVLS